MPIPISPLIFERGAAGVPSFSTPIANLAYRADSYEHTISDRYGFESMRVPFVATLDEAIDWLINGLGRTVLTINPEGMPVWEGLIETVSLKIGQKSVSASLRDIGNRVRCKYTTVLGTPGTTTATSNTTSQAIYGTKDYVVSLNNSTATAAANRAARVLTAIAFPRANVPTEASSGDIGNVTVEIQCAGWYSTLEWLVTSSSTTSTAVTTTQVASLLSTYVATNNFLSTSTINIAASGISDTQYIEPETTYKQKIEDLLGQGDSSNNPLTWGIYENREFYVATWAGATPTTITYQEDAAQGVIYDAKGGKVLPWDVRPNAMSRVLQLSDTYVAGTVDTSSIKYIGRVTCHISGDTIGCTLEPSDVQSVDTLISILAGK